MASELKIKPNIVLENGRLRWKYQPSQFVCDQSAGRLYDRVHTIGTSEESVTTFGDVSTPGMVSLLNLDGTNYVDWGFATGAYDGRMTANDGSATTGIPWVLFNGQSGLELYLKADTAACEVRITVFDA